MSHADLVGSAVCVTLCVCLVRTLGHHVALGLLLMARQGFERSYVFRSVLSGLPDNRLLVQSHCHRRVQNYPKYS